MNATKRIHFELEQKMGDGSWEPVFQTKEEANYETPQRVAFNTMEEARAYGNGNPERFNDAIDRGYVRIVKVTTGRIIFL